MSIIKEKIIQVTKFYFKCFQNKNLKELENIFANTIYLVDWENKIKGKKKNLNFLKKIFIKNTFQIQLKNFFLHKNKRIISIQILIKLKNKKIKVIDIISFNKKYEITKIQAYKC